MTKHPWRLLLALVALVALLAACGEDAPDVADTDDDVDEVDTADEPEAPAEGEEITVWIMQPGSEEIEQLLEGYTAEFEEETGPR